MDAAYANRQGRSPLASSIYIEYLYTRSSHIFQDDADAATFLESQPMCDEQFSRHLGRAAYLDDRHPLKLSRYTMDKIAAAEVSVEGPLSKREITNTFGISGGVARALIFNYQKRWALPISRADYVGTRHTERGAPRITCEDLAHPEDREQELPAPINSHELVEYKYMLNSKNHAEENQEKRAAYSLVSEEQNTRKMARKPIGRKAPHPSLTPTVEKGEGEIVDGEEHGDWVLV